jgi:OmpA-OmpF porin, OOP family
MATFDDLSEEIAARFFLGPKAHALMQEVLRLITAQPGGLEGFVEKFKAVGLEDWVSSWLRDRFPMVLSGRQVKKALGTEVVKGVADDAGVTESLAGQILGYAIPKAVVWLKEGGMPIRASTPALASVAPPPLPSRRPAAFSSSSSSRTSGQVPGPRKDGSEGDAGPRLLLPGAALVITLALFGYAIFRGTASDHAAVQSAPHLAQNAPAASQERASTHPLAPSSNEERPGALPGAAATGVNSAAAIGGFAVQTGWINNLKAEFASFGGNASQLLFAGNGFEAQETMPRAAHADMIGSLPETHLPQFVVASLTGSGPAGIGTTLSPMLASATPSKEEHAPTSIEASLESLSIDFRENSTRIPPRSILLLRQAADLIKQLPAGTVVELNGYTDSTGSPAVNMKISERRADSVYQALIREGVSPAKLKAKGIGNASQLASAGSATEGRSTALERPERNDRRVDFRVVQQQQ